MSDVLSLTKKQAVQVAEEENVVVPAILLQETYHYSRCIKVFNFNLKIHYWMYLLPIHNRIQ